MTSPVQSQLQRIRDGIIGSYTPMDTPFGRRPLVYADYTASGRALRSIESQIRETVLPWYANTHSETSLSGAQTTALREAARRTIHAALNGGAQDKIIFCGAGATAAINRLVAILGLQAPGNYSSDGLRAIPPAQRPVVFVGPYEHHSNELPWRESVAEVVPIPLAPDGAIDREALATALVVYAERPLRIGAFSAASNVTGIRSDVQGITRQLKRGGALAFWDYAAAGPYVGIDLNGEGAAIDALFLSPHKFVGGPGTPGILAVKASLLSNTVPAVPGGGTVSFVSPQEHRYLDDPERREEGGTPAIVETIRAGLVFKLQQSVGTKTIETLEHARIREALTRLARLRSVEVLGGTAARRLSIVSLHFCYGSRDLHYGFVVALLNDLFGIQARGGCSCAGPYGHALLGIDPDRSRALDHAVTSGESALRPGWVRLNFNYFIDDGEFAYLLGALELIAEYGWRLLPTYRLDRSAGLWRHREAELRVPASFDDIDPLAEPVPAPLPPRPDFVALLEEGEAIMRRGASEKQIQAALTEPPLSADREALRWFVSAGEVARELDRPSGVVPTPTSVPAGARERSVRPA